MANISDALKKDLNKLSKNPKEQRRSIPVLDDMPYYRRNKLTILEDIDLSIDRESLNEVQIEHIEDFIKLATLQDVKMKYKGLTQKDQDVFLKLEKDQDLVDNFTDEFPEYFA